jgi:hypothetical protein
MWESTKVMARRPSRDVDLLMLIREEEAYALRIRDALVFSESKLERPPAPLAERSQEISEARRELYARPASMAELADETYLEPEDVEQCRSKNRSARRKLSDEDLVLPAAEAYINPPINRRKTVDDNDALYSAESVRSGRVEFSYADLIATREGRKITTVRSLRRLANLWDINPKLNKDEMLSNLIIEYARRYEDEVAAYEARRTGTRSGKIRRRARRR